jgi:hypothetical protein
VSAKSRIERLEQRQGRWTAPYVVVQREGESLETAKLRALNGHPAPPRWKFILAPEPMSAQEWDDRYGPVIDQQ